MREKAPDILCIGAVLWDIIGRSPAAMKLGSDVPGRITRLPGGVALNIAMTFARLGLRPAALGAIGRDAEGEELILACERLGIDIAHTYRPEDLPTDRYMAIEGANGLIAAIANAHSLELAGARILAPLSDGRLGSPESPWAGPVCLDGNLTTGLLREIATSPLFSRASLHAAPASPGKAERLIALMGHPSAVLYTNREEAGLICREDFPDASAAALGMTRRGAARAVVTDGERLAAEAMGNDVIALAPPEVMVARVTGAGDTLMAAHIAALSRGADRQGALAAAVRAAAIYVSGEHAE